MDQMLSVCGLLCSQCNFCGNECRGCLVVKGATFWAKEAMPEGICPLYQCAVMDKKLENCGQCSELPCNKFMGLKDPNISDEQHNQSIQERVSRLKPGGSKPGPALK